METQSEGTYTRRASGPYRDAAMLAVGFGAGMLATYLLDARQGARRRAVLSDRAGSISRASGRRALKLLRHTRNQVEGFLALAADLVTPQGVPSDRRLHDRIRSRLGHAASHLTSMSLEVKGGEVTLQGKLPEQEARTIVAEIARIRGVRAVVDKLERLISEGGTPIQ